MTFFFEVFVSILCLCGVALAVGLTAMAVTGCFGQAAENVEWLRRVLR